MAGRALPTLALTTLLLIVASNATEFSSTDRASFETAAVTSKCVNNDNLPWEDRDCTSPWTYCANGTCKCGNISEDILQCHQNKSSTISHCYCVTFDETTGLTSAGNCINTCGFGARSNLYHALPNNKMDLDDYLCGPFNRTGTLCGKCRDGLYPLVFSLDMNCVDCPNGKSNWWKYVLATFLPLTVFFFIVLFFNVNVTSSSFHGFIWYIQGLAIPPLARVVLITIRQYYVIVTGARCGLALYGIWTLDFLRSFDLGICLGTDTLQTLALELAVGVYPFLFMVITYNLIHLYDRNFQPLVIIWKPFRSIFGLFRRNWEIRTSLIDSFGTFFLLSNAKLLSVSYDLLALVKIYQLNSTSPEPIYTYRLYYDATVPYFGERHLPYAVLSIILLVFCMILPTLLLMFYPFRWSHKFLNLFPFRWYILHTFMDNIHGCYKDGTQPGTRDCRWFASVFFTLRFVIMCIGVYTLNAMYYCMTSIVLTLFIIILVNIQPFKDNGVENIIFMCLSAIWHIGTVGLNLQRIGSNNIFLLASLTVALLPVVYASAIAVHWMYKNRNFGSGLVRKLRAWRQGYQQLN